MFAHMTAEQQQRVITAVAEATAIQAASA